ncbi:MAG: RNA polymerase sigma factor, partial [Clostridiales Family XIII bacterium]|nr:RNA polymerase sigma factor [Clostridiales Family XIII bacterium]
RRDVIRRQHILKYFFKTPDTSACSIVLVVKEGKAMAKSLLRTDKEVAEIYMRQMRTVYRVCFTYMKNAADTEDAVQDTFYKMLASGVVFESGEHEKAWLIRTAANVCKNSIRHWFRKHEDLADYENLQGAGNIEIDDTFEAVMGLPDKYKSVVYLYYYEGCTTPEISDILQKPQSTIRNHLHEARGVLKEKLGGEFQ